MDGTANYREVHGGPWARWRRPNAHLGCETLVVHPDQDILLHGAALDALIQHHWLHVHPLEHLKGRKVSDGSTHGVFTAPSLSNMA